MHRPVRDEARMQVVLDLVAAADRGRHADVSRDDGSNRQHDQRERHRRRRVVQVIVSLVRRSPQCVMATAWPCRRRRRVRRAPLAVERQEHEPEHVRRREQRREDADGPEDPVAGGECLPEDLVLAEEARESGHASNRDRADQERPVGDRQILLQSAHVADVLLTGQRVDDGARAEEEQRLEERMRVKMEDAGAVRAHPHRQEHVAELRDRRIRQHALDVVLDQADRAGHQRRRRADDGDDQERDRRVAEQLRVPPDHVDAGRHHGRGVDERGDRRRTFHRVWQPDVQRNLRRLAGGADEQEQRRQGDHAEARFLRQRPHLIGEVLEVERPERRPQQRHPEDERKVADAVDDERLLAGVGRGLLGIPESDEEIRAEAHALPTDEEHRERRAEDEDEHERREQVQVREVPRVFAVGLLVHVRGRVDVDQASRCR